MNENKRRMEIIGIAAITAGLTAYLGTLNNSPVTWGIVAAAIGLVIYAVSIGLCEDKTGV